MGVEGEGSPKATQKEVEGLEVKSWSSGAVAEAGVLWSKDSEVCLPIPSGPTAWRGWDNEGGHCFSMVVQWETTPGSSVQLSFQGR